MARGRGEASEVARLRRQLAAAERERAELFASLSAVERERAGLADTLPIAAHQLLSPVQTLLLWRDALAAHGRRDEPVDKAWLRAQAAKMRRQLERIDTLMRAALEIWRGGLRGLAPRGEADLAATVRAVVDAHADEAALAGCRIDVTAPATLVGPWDADQLRFVVAGLVSNAIKHGGGAPVHVELADGGARATLRVADEGPGFAPGTAAELFRPFSPGRRSDGFGLGLWIVHELAQALGGSVRATSVPGRGAVFTVVLRKSAHAASARRARRGTRLARLSPKELPR